MSKSFRTMTLLLVTFALFLSACAPTAAPAPAPQPTTAAAQPTAAPVQQKPTEPPAAPPPTEPPAPAKPVDLEVWVGAAVSEAGPPPDDWAAYQIVREKLGINLKIVLL